jgi:predicted transposase YdaD
VSEVEDQFPKPISSLRKQSFDATFKNWISQQATAILPLLLPGASYESALNIELNRPPMRVDKAFQVVYDGGKCLLHVEFQTKSERELYSRLLAYNSLLYRDYELPVITLIVYPFRVTTARSPLRIQTPLGNKKLVTFHFETLPLFKLNAWNVVQQRQTCLYPLLPTMKGIQADMIIRAIEELIALYRDDQEILNQQFVWMKLLMERSSTLRESDKVQIQRRLSMFDQLWEESKMVKQMREEYFEKGIEKGIEKGVEKGIEQGIEKGTVKSLLQFVEIRFPSLLAVAKQIIEQPRSGEQLRSLLYRLYRANTIEEARAVLLQG